MRRNEMKVWTETEIRTLIATDDRVLYRALRKIYSCQTEQEKVAGQTLECNGAGFNAVDSRSMSRICEYLVVTGSLTVLQRQFARDRLKKYNGQLTRIANEVEEQKCRARTSK